MRRSTFLAVLCTFAAAAIWAVSTATAAVQFNKGPTCTQTSSTLVTCSGKASGLGSGPIYIATTVASGCQNQDGTHVIPGHSTTVSGPFNTTNGSLAFGLNEGDSVAAVTASGPTCTGSSQTSFATAAGATLSIYSCPTGTLAFNKKGQASSNCTLLITATATVA